MIKLKSILLEIGSHVLPIEQLVNKFLKFEERTIVFLNLKTIGTDANEKQSQLQKLKVIVVDGSTMKDIKRLNIQVNTTNYTKKFMDKVTPAGMDLKSKEYENPRSFLNMNNYFKKVLPKNLTEIDAIKTFKKVIETSINPIIISDNANFIFERANFYGIQLLPVSIISNRSAVLSFFLPALQLLNDSGLIKRMKKFKLVKLKDVSADSPIEKDKETETEPYTDPSSGEQYLKIYYGHAASKVGELSPEILNHLKEPNTIVSDVKIVIMIFNKIIKFLKEHPDLNITPKELSNIRRKKHAIKKNKNDKT